MEYAIDVLPATGIDQLETLWLELLDHHLRAAPHLAALGLPRDPGDSWRRRRGQYLEWLATPPATVLIARGPARPLGYAMVRIAESGYSWRWGDRVGVLETLVISDAARGAGVGQALLKAARERLAGWGARVMMISVIAGNEGALRFYRREGAVDFEQTLIMPVGGGAAPGR